MLETSALYQYAEQSNATVMRSKLPVNGSLCIDTDEQSYYIGIDETMREGSAEHRTHLGHELGHCATGSFYNRYATCDVRQKHENRADRWMIEHMIPEAELNAAVADGHTEAWDLAELFGVTEEYVRKAVLLYKRKCITAEI